MAKLNLILFIHNSRAHVDAANVELNCGTVFNVEANGKVVTGGETMPDEIYVTEIESIARQARQGLDLLTGKLTLRVEDPKKKRRKK
jgi:hypothetical protein